MEKPIKGESDFDPEEAMTQTTNVVRLNSNPNKRGVWQCNLCGHIELKEQEVGCWKCPKPGPYGEMIYVRPQN
jgi:hypothetical protein